MANGHGGRRAGAGRKRGSRSNEAILFQRQARSLCPAGLEAMADLLKSDDGSMRARAFDRIFQVAYGKELKDIVVDDEQEQPKKDKVVWPSDPNEAIPDPARIKTS